MWELPSAPPPPPLPPSPPPPPTGTDDDELEALSVTQALLIVSVLLLSTMTITYLCAQRCPRRTPPPDEAPCDDAELGTTPAAPAMSASAVRPLSPSDLAPPEWPMVAARLLSRTARVSSLGTMRSKSGGSSSSGQGVWT